jgi:chromosome segregation ATPase
MDMNELKSLEEKTKQIVETLSTLESEVSTYQAKNLKIDAAIDGISELSQKLSAASSDFLSIIEILRKSDLGNALEELDSKIKKLDSLHTQVLDANKDLLEKQDEIKAQLDNFQQTLTVLDSKIGRVDRNTQKGIGKEKG